MGVLGGLIGGALGAASGIFGGISKNKMLSEQERLLREQERENQNWFDRRYNEDSTQRADAQAVLTRLTEMIRNRNKAAEGSAAVMGGTDESVAAAKEAGNRAIADTMSNIAASGDRRKDIIEGQYRNRDHEIDENLRAVAAQKKNIFDIANDAVGGAWDGFGSGLDLNFPIKKQ